MNSVKVVLTNVFYQQGSKIGLRKIKVDSCRNKATNAIRFGKKYSLKVTKEDMRLREGLCFREKYLVPYFLFITFEFGSK